MANFRSGSVDLHYEDHGRGPAVVLLHGFGMTGKLCWADTGWLDLLAAAGFRAVALDSRGHGQSAKPIDPQDYAASAMTEDVLRLLAHLQVDSAHLVGHSMGARTAFNLALNFSDRVISLIAVSVGSNLFEQVQPGAFIQAFKEDDPVNVPSAVRQTVETLLAMGNSREAMLACLASPRPVPKQEDLRSVVLPVLVACGEGDAIVGNPATLAAALSNGLARVISGREHTDVLASAELKELALSFLKSVTHPKERAVRP